MPPPEIRIPVCPVARKSTARPRALKARAIASAVYFLPSAQSVPTVSRRLPLRLEPVPQGMFGGGTRTSISRRPQRAAAAASAGTEPSFTCRPLTMSSPASSASTSSGTQVGPITPPVLAMPITRPRAPRTRASFGVMRGRPVVTVALSQPHSPSSAPGPSRAGQRRSWRRTARSHRRGTAGTGLAAASRRPLALAVPGCVSHS